MYPRLKLARNLLKDDGVIFISIDDNEVHNLRKICDEVFGESNFIAQLSAILNLKGNNDEYGFAGTHEYILVYNKVEKNTEFFNIPIKDKKEIERIWDIDNFGYYKSGTLKSGGENGTREKRPNLYFPIYVNKENKSFSIQDNISYTDILLPISYEGKDLTWRWSKNKIEKEKHNILLNIDNNGKIKIERKIRPQNNIPSVKPKSVFYKPEYSSGNGIKRIKELFDNTKVFSYSKPVEIIKDILGITTKNNDIILDFFAGSGTTADAVMQLNAEDKGELKYICVQIPEKTDEKSEALRLITKISVKLAKNAFAEPVKK
jgi:adenine-specific DNA-methyltransferase